jgi:hypothetical protein
MKRLWYFIIPLILLSAFILVFRTQRVANMLYIEDVRLEQLLKYRIENKDDLKNFGEIFSRLPGNISCSGTGLAWDNDITIDISYDYYQGNRHEMRKLERYWENNREKIFLFNATTYLILIPEAQKITITLDIPYMQKFEVTRQELEILYGRDLNKYYENTSLWKKEIIKDVIDSPKRLNGFFQVHEIQEIT